MFEHNYDITPDLKIALPVAAKINFKDLHTLFGTGEFRAEKYAKRQRLPLFEDFFDICEGPLIVPYTSKAAFYSNDVVSVSVKTNSHWFGLKNRQRSTYLESHKTGINLTALCAYLGRLSPEIDSPLLSTYYEGDYPESGRKPYDQNYIENPFNINSANISFMPEGDEKRLQDESLLFMGRVSVGSIIPIGYLPFSIERQEEVLKNLTGVDYSDEIYASFGVSGSIQLHEIWLESMLETTPLKAAQSIQALAN